MMGAARIVNRSFPGHGDARPLRDRDVRFCRAGVVARQGEFFDKAGFLRFNLGEAQGRKQLGRIGFGCGSRSQVRAGRKRGV